ELRVRFAGDSSLGPVTTSVPVVRRAQVALVPAGPIEASDPEEGVGIDVAVVSSRGPVSGGVVEALRAGESVGAGDVEAGRARVVASFAAGRARGVPLVLRYVS